MQNAEQFEQRLPGNRMELRDPDLKRRKKKREMNRKRESFKKNKPHFVASTPSSSVPPISYINQSLANTNRDQTYIIRRGDRVEINLSKMRFRKVTRVDDNFATKYKEIHFLDLSDNVLNSLPECFQLSTVKSISLQYNSLVTLKVTHTMTKLVELNLSGNKVDTFPNVESLRHMPSIQRLFLNNNSIREIPVESIMALRATNLTVLNLAYNKLTSLPLEIGRLDSLCVFNLSDNDIEELPHTILLLSNLLKNSTSFNIQRNKLVSPPQEIADRSGLISIMKHFRASGVDCSGHRTANDTVRATHLRMVVVGNEGAGKSTIIQQMSSAQLDAKSLVGDSPLLFAPTSMPESQLSQHVPNRIRLQPAVREALRSLLGGSDGPELLADPITVNVCDFSGQEMYHAAAEMFFSETSLHLVVFDLSVMATEHDCDMLVQYWVDLIQARAPGSAIVVVATHIDAHDMTPDLVEERLFMVHKRLARNEQLRLTDLGKEIRLCAKEDPQHAKELEALLQKRPFIHSPILRFASEDAQCMSLKHLLAHISALASPTVENPYPLRIVNGLLPMRYQSVKILIGDLRDRGRHFCTIRDLDNAVNSRFDKYMLPEEVQSCSKASTLETTQNAVVYWASVGEVRKLHVYSVHLYLLHVICMFSLQTIAEVTLTCALTFALSAVLCCECSAGGLVPAQRQQQPYPQQQFPRPGRPRTRHGRLNH
jgi:Leucine-rich repeat (LRR) protein